MQTKSKPQKKTLLFKLPRKSPSQRPILFQQELYKSVLSPGFLKLNMKLSFGHLISILVHLKVISDRNNPTILSWIRIKTDAN